MRGPYSGTGILLLILAEEASAGSSARSGSRFRAAWQPPLAVPEFISSGIFHRREAARGIGTLLVGGGAALLAFHQAK